MLTWCDDQYAVVQEGFAGNSMPVPVSKRNLVFLHHNIKDNKMATIKLTEKRIKELQECAKAGKEALEVLRKEKKRCAARLAQSKPH